MQTVQQIAEDIVAREGGFVNDPDDPGGATNHGVTLGTLQRLRRDLDGDGQIDVDDVRAVTPRIATDIFVQHYFEGPQIGLLPEALWPTVFDMYVNAGSEAVKILQRLLCDMRIPVTVDGVIGPETAGAAAKALDAAPDHLVDAYGIARRNYYYGLADRRPALRKFARRRDGGKGGWIARAEAFIRPKYWLTDFQHASRVATWG